MACVELATPSLSIKNSILFLGKIPPLGAWEKQYLKALFLYGSASGHVSS